MNSKIFHSPFCCCFSLSIETLIIIHFVYLAIEFLFGLQKPITNIGIKSLFFIFSAFLSPIFLFISTKNHNYGFARLSLYFAELVGLKCIFIIKEALKDFKKVIFNELEEYCKDDDSDSCFLVFIGLVLGLTIELLFLCDQFYFIYLAYYQLSFIQHKNAQKLE